MKQIFDNIISISLILLFVLGYFPINMIIAYIYGDKMDLLISFFIPFYGLFLMLFN